MTSTPDFSACPASEAILTTNKMTMRENISKSTEISLNMIYSNNMFCESQQSLVDLLTSSVFTYCSSFVVSMVTSPFISIVWCFRPYKPYIFWKLIIWWWQWPRQILTKRRRHEIRFYALLGLNIFQGSIFSRSEYFSLFSVVNIFRGENFSSLLNYL